jgi:hypothetical protein
LPDSPSATSSQVRACVVCELFFSASANVLVTSVVRSTLISPRLFGRFARSTSSLPVAPDVAALIFSFGASISIVVLLSPSRLNDLTVLLGGGAGDAASELATGARFGFFFLASRARETESKNGQRQRRHRSGQDH